MYAEEPISQLARSTQYAVRNKEEKAPPDGVMGGSAGASRRDTHIHPRTLRPLLAHKISDNAAQNGLMRDDEDVAAVFSAAAAL